MRIDFEYTYTLAEKLFVVLPSMFYDWKDNELSMGWLFWACKIRFTIKSKKPYQL